MEEVKTKATLLEPDIRRTIVSISNRTTGQTRRAAFEDLKARVDDIAIPTAAPEEIRDLLVTAKNLILYSWYYYPFTMSAALQSAAALEQALRLRLNATERDTLGFLLRQAIKQGLLTDAGFPRWKEYNAAFAKLHPVAGKPAKMSYVRHLANHFPRARNAAAHGNRFMEDLGPRHLDIVCEAIAQLYPGPTKRDGL
ncbi:MAG: hypothetical protein PSV13_07820 [Lacunisphaera sp.]|nr:hypothetical protein [Lacunisphaera sp.]